jgi:monothiol glutaredoxin
MLRRSLFSVVRHFSSEPVDSTSAKEIIEAILSKGKVVLFMKGTPTTPQCGFSNYAIQVLNHYKVKNFYFYNILEDAYLREELKKYSDWPTYPQLYINKEFIGGADILAEMHKSNTLQELFDKHDVVVKE